MPVILTCTNCDCVISKYEVQKSLYSTRLCPKCKKNTLILGYTEILPEVDDTLFSQELSEFVETYRLKSKSLNKKQDQIVEELYDYKTFLKDAIRTVLGLVVGNMNALLNLSEILVNEDCLINTSEVVNDLLIVYHEMLSTSAENAMVSQEVFKDSVRRIYVKYINDMVGLDLYFSVTDEIDKISNELYETNFYRYLYFVECINLRFPKWIIDKEKEDSKKKVCNLLSDYVILLYMVPQFINDLELAGKIEANQEFKELVLKLRKNSIQIKDTDCYSLYLSYYPELFGCEPVSDIKLAEIINALVLKELAKNQFDSITEKLNGIGIDVGNMVSEWINTVGEDTFSNYFLKSIIETGRIDVLFKSDDYLNSFYALFDMFSYYLLDYMDLQEYFHEIVSLLEMKKKIELYRKKYILLHPELETSNEESIKDKLSNIKTGVDFENVLKELFEKIGYKVETTKTTGDQGADLVIEKQGVKSVIQAKYYSSTVGNSAVQEVVAAKAFYQASKMFVITNSTFTEAAKTLALANDVNLIDGNTLNVLIDIIT